MTLDSGQ